MRFKRIISLALAATILSPSIARAKDFNTPEGLINTGGSMQSQAVVEKKDPEPIRSRLIAVLDNKSNVADATWSKGFVTDLGASSTSPGITKGDSRVNYVLSNVAASGLDSDQQKRILEACEKIKSGKAKDQDYVIVHLANVLIQLVKDNGVLPDEERYNKAKDAVVAEPKKKDKKEPAHVSAEEAKRKQIAILEEAVITRNWSKFDAQRNTVLSALEGQSPEAILQLLEGFGYMEKLFQISGGNFELFKKILLKVDEKMLSPKSRSEFNFSDFVESLDFLRNDVLSGLRRGGTPFVSVGTGGTAGINAIDYNDLEKKINTFLDKLGLKTEMDPAIARYLITGVFDSLVGEDSLKKGTTFKLGSAGWKDVAKELRSIGAEIRTQNLWNLYLGNTEANLQAAYQRIADRLLKAVKPVDSQGRLDEAVARNMLAYVLGTGVGADSLIEVSFRDEKPVVSINQKRWSEVQQQVHYINDAVAKFNFDATTQANLTNLLSKVPPESLFELSALFTMFTYRPGMANAASTVVDILTRISNFDPSLVGDWAHALIILGARASDPDVKTVMDLVLTNLSSLISTGAVPFSYEKRYLLYSIANRLVNFTQNMANPLGRHGLLDLMSVENIPSQDVETLDATVDHTGMERALRNGLLSLPQARLMYLNTLTVMGKFQSVIATDTSMATPVGIAVPGRFILTLTPDRLREVMQSELQFNMPVPTIPDAALYTRYELNSLIAGIQSAFMIGVPALGVPGRLGQVGLGFRADITPKTGQADVYERDFKVTWPDGTETQVTATRTSQGTYKFSAEYGGVKYEDSLTLTKNKKTGQWEVSGIQENGVSPTATALGSGRLRKKTDTTTSYGGGGIFEVTGENGSFIAAGGAAYKTADEDGMLAQAGIAGANLRFADGFGLISGRVNYQYQEFIGMSQHDLIGDTRLALFSQMARQRHADILVLGEYHGTKPSTEGAVENNQGKIKFYLFGADGSVLKAGYINYADVKDKQLLEQLLGAMGDWNAISTMGGVVWKEGGRNPQGTKPDAYESYVGFDVSGWGLRETFSKAGVDVSGAGIWREIERGFNGAVQRYRHSVSREWAAAGSVNFLKNWAVGVIYSTYEAELPTEAGIASAKKGYWRILGAYHDDNRIWARGYVGFESTADEFNMFALAEMFARDLGSFREMYARLSGGAPNYQAVLDGGNIAADVYTKISAWVDAEFQGYSDKVKVFIKASYFRAVLEQAKENIVGQAPLNADELSNLNASMNIFYLYALLKVNGYSGALLVADQRFARIASFMQSVNDPRIDDADRAKQMQNLTDSFKDDFWGSSLWQLVIGKDGKWQLASTVDVLEKRGEGTFIYLRDDGWAIGGTVTYQQIQRPYYKKVESEVPVLDDTTGETVLNPDGTPLMEKQVSAEAATKDEAMWTVTGITGVRGSWRLEVTYGQREHYGVDAATAEDPKKLHALMLKALVSLPNDVFLSIAGGMISHGGAAFFTEKPLEAQGEVIVHCTVNGVPFFLGLNVSHGQYTVTEIDENDLPKMLEKGATLYKIPFGITFDTNSALGKMTIVVEPTFSDRGFEGGQIGLVTSKPGLEAGIYAGYRLTNAPNPDLRNPATTRTHLQSQIENSELLFRILMIRAFVSVYHYSPE